MAVLNEQNTLCKLHHVKGHHKSPTVMETPENTREPFMAADLGAGGGDVLWDEVVTGVGEKMGTGLEIQEISPIDIVEVRKVQCFQKVL